MAEIREIHEQKSEVCARLLRALPPWFGIEEAIQNYTQEVAALPMLVAFEQTDPIGFLALTLHNEYTAEIHVMAIHPKWHRRGIGRALALAAEEFLRAKSFEFLTVKTLSPARENNEYALTRKFYLALGFRPVEEFKTLWGAANPCLLLIKKL